MYDKENAGMDVNATLFSSNITERVGETQTRAFIPSYECLSAKHKTNPARTARLVTLRKTPRVLSPSFERKSANLGNSDAKTTVAGRPVPQPPDKRWKKELLHPVRLFADRSG